MAWTARQQKAIEERGKSLLVSAAAGSGKTSVLKGFNYEDGATARIRNGLVGGHKE